MSQKIKLSGKVVTRFTTKPEIKQTVKQDVESFDLRVYILALKYKYANIGDTYEETAMLVNREFNVNITARELWLLDEGNVELEMQDRKLVWENNTK